MSPTLLARGDDVPGEDAGNVLVQQAAAMLSRQPALEAKVRQRATLFDQRVSGAGFYLQLRDGDQLLTRYEFKLQVAEQMTSLLQVNDGTTLWIRHDRGQLKSQAYVNVRRLRDAKQRLQGRKSIAIDAVPDLAFGGLGELLRNIEYNFRFDKPQETQPSNMPMWELSGTWKPERLAEIAPTANQSSTASIDSRLLPSHLPHAVKLVLRRDERFPLFPARILFGRIQPRDSIASLGPSKPASVDPFLTIELYEVQRRPDLTPADFAFQPSDENVEDRTDEYLRKLGLEN